MDDDLKSNEELLQLINKDIISVLVSIIDEKTDECYLNTTDCYYLEDRFEYKAIAVGYTLTLSDIKYEVKQVNMEFMFGGLTDIEVSNKKGILNPYSAVLNVYVKKLS